MSADTLNTLSLATLYLTIALCLACATASAWAEWRDR